MFFVTAQASKVHFDSRSKLRRIESETKNDKIARRSWQIVNAAVDLSVAANVSFSHAKSDSVLYHKMNNINPTVNI